MNSFIVKYIVAILVIAVMTLFADNTRTAILLVIAGFLVLLSFVESFTIDGTKIKENKINETTYKKVEMVIHLLPTNRY